jgi:hypothetical protein
LNSIGQFRNEISSKEYKTLIELEAIHEILMNIPRSEKNW